MDDILPRLCGFDLLEIRDRLQRDRIPLFGLFELKIMRFRGMLLFLL